VTARDLDAAAVSSHLTAGALRPPRIVLIAGEPSGDVLGARLMAALRAATDGKVQITGIGGPMMAAQGLHSWVPMTDLALFGVIELLPRLPRLIGHLNRTIRTILADPPDALVTIDSPGFTVRVARRVRRAQMQGTIRRFPLIHYVAPTVWAWRPERAPKMAAIFDHLLALLPFEPPWFTRVGLPCSFVGHPVVEGTAAQGNAQAFRERHALEPDRRVLAVLPGSRRSELRSLLPVFSQALKQLADSHPDLVTVVPTLAHIRPLVEAGTAGWPLPTIIVEGEADKADVFACADAALAASGTVALELALARVPAVIAYRLNPVTVWLYRRLITTKYANLVNIMLDRMAVPELLQENCRPKALAQTLADLLDHDDARSRQKTAYDGVASWLGEGETPPSRRAAETILHVMHETAQMT